MIKKNAFSLEGGWGVKMYFYHPMPLLWSYLPTFCAGVHHLWPLPLPVRAPPQKEEGSDCHLHVAWPPSQTHQGKKEWHAGVPCVCVEMAALIWMWVSWEAVGNACLCIYKREREDNGQMFMCAVQMGPGFVVFQYMVQLYWWILCVVCFSTWFSLANGSCVFQYTVQL